jgi:hypothetical protein
LRHVYVSFTGQFGLVTILLGDYFIWPLFYSAALDIFNRLAKYWLIIHLYGLIITAVIIMQNTKAKDAPSFQRQP